MSDQTVSHDAAQNPERGLPQLTGSTHAIMTGLIAHKVQFRDTDFTGADLTDARITNSLGTNALFIRGTLTGAAFDGSSLTSTSFSEASCVNASFVDCDVRKAEFGGAKLRNANLSEVLADRARFSFADLGGASLIGGHFVDAVFSGANLEGADLSDTVLSGAHFNGANLRGVILKGALLEDAWFDQVRGLYLATVNETFWNSTYLYAVDHGDKLMFYADPHWAEADELVEKITNAQWLKGNTDSLVLRDLKRAIDYLTQCWGDDIERNS